MLPSVPRAPAPWLLAIGVVMASLALANFAPRELLAENAAGVAITPAVSETRVEDGYVTVYVMLEDLQHFGTLSYDDNRDTVVDRQLQSNGMGAFEFRIEYNPGILAVAGVVPGPELGRTGRRFQCLPPRQDPGVLTYGCISSGDRPDGPQGALTLAEVAFRAVQPGTSTLVLGAEVTGPLGTDSVDLSLGSGVVEVSGKRLTKASSATAAQAGGTAMPSPAGPTGGSDPTGRSLLAATPASAAAGTAVARAEADARAEGTPSLAVAEGGRDKEAAREQTADGGGGGGNGGMLWWATGAGAITLVVGLALGGVLWQRRRAT